MKAVLFSDTHRLKPTYTSGPVDLAIHTGDACNSSSRKQMKFFLDWFRDIPARHHIYVAGNHDGYAAQHRVFFKELVREARVTYLEHEALELEGWKIFGSPFIPRIASAPEGVNHFAKGVDALRMLWEKIPLDTQILLTHAPKKYSRDRVWPHGENVGCEELGRRALVLADLKYHVHGHIHESFGIEYTQEKFITINAAYTQYDFLYQIQPERCGYWAGEFRKEVSREDFEFVASAPAQ